jgi:hypothetical protein
MLLGSIKNFVSSKMDHPNLAPEKNKKKDRDQARFFT